MKIFAMSFDDLKVIWDSQSNEQHYAVNEDGLHTMLRQKSKDMRRIFFWQEAQTYGSMTLVIVAVLIYLVAMLAGLIHPNWNRWDVTALLVGMATWLFFGFSVFLHRRRERSNLQRFKSSLRDELERDIEHLDSQIDSREHLIRWYIPPYTGAVLFIWVNLRMVPLPDWLVVPIGCAMVVAMFFEARGQRQLVEKELIPRKEELVSLREKLTESSL